MYNVYISDRKYNIYNFWIFGFKKVYKRVKPMKEIMFYIKEKVIIITIIIIEVNIITEKKAIHREERRELY